MGADLGLRPPEQALVDRLPVSRWSRHGIPDTEQRARRERAAALTARALEAVGKGHVEASVLGPAWSSDIDVEGDVAAMRTALSALGWPRLDPWLAGIGSPARDVYAVLDGDEVLGAVDLQPLRRTGPRDPVTAVLARARRRGEVRLREALELLRLEADGAKLPSDDEVVRAARLLQQSPDVEPIVLRNGRARRAVANVRRSLRPRLVVAVSGVDGAGKSTTAAALADALERCGLPVSRVWVRPGMNLGPLDRLARAIKRLTRADPAPAVRAVAAGATSVPSRQGVVGWAWSLLVAIAFAVDVGRQHAGARGVVIYDRHRPDALATLDVLYRGANLEAQRRIVVAALPAAALTVYLRIDADLAVARKPGDPIGRLAVQAQLEQYEERLAAVPRLVTLDATRPTAAIVRQVIAALDAGATRSRRRRA